MTLQPGVLAVVAAAGLDWLIGDPRRVLHPVVVMGWWIQRLRRLAEAWAEDSPWKLRLAGGLITLLLVGSSGLVGMAVEQLARQWPLVGWPLIVIGLASALAARSLHDSVRAVVQALPQAPSHDLALARDRLSWIVGRDVTRLDETEILRASAETAAENAVDGLFAPLFWMTVGCCLWMVNPGWPGPLAMAWMFKATSTLDSMLGYRTGRLRWLGTAGARLDDLLTWMPCRLVMLSLPLVSAPWRSWPHLVHRAQVDGASDPSPNAGRSEAIYAHCAGVRLGGLNRYGERLVEKPVLAPKARLADRQSIDRILKLTNRLQALWLLVLLLVLAQ